ncbi:MAG: tRNA (adenosine(37)-N6)-threonylcarbamoyltransferase complex ATPase subunit type 1 TsaE, partial [Gemmatimonadota bacterium]
MRLDEAELVRWGTGIGADVNPPVVIGLSGQLGAGKSVLARAIGAGAGVTATMPSPSYTLVQRYQGRDGRL